MEVNMKIEAFFKFLFWFITTAFIGLIVFIIITVAPLIAEEPDFPEFMTLFYLLMLLFLTALLARFTACIMAIYTIFNTRLPIRLTIKDRFRFDLSILKRVMKIGYASAGEQFVMRTGVLVFTKIVADLGTVPFAAHQVSLNILGFSFNFGQAFGMAATSFMGRNLGAQRPDLAETYGKEIRRMGLVVSIFVSLCFFFGGHWIASLYTSDVNVIAKSALVLKMVAFIIPAQTSQMIIAGGLRGAGDTHWPLVATICGIFGVRMLMGAAFVNIFSWGLTGAWLAIGADQYVRSIVIFFRFKSGKWKTTKV